MSEPVNAANPRQRRTLLPVLLLGQAWPDIVVGARVAIIAFKGGLEILLDGRRAARGCANESGALS